MGILVGLVVLVAGMVSFLVIKRVIKGETRFSLN